MDEQETRQPLPFEGLHVYQRAQEAWTLALETAGAGGDPLLDRLADATREAALGIARATARSRAGGGFAAELERARGAVHDAAAIADQLARRGDPSDDRLRALLNDASRMLGALIRSVTQPHDEPAEAVV